MKENPDKQLNIILMHAAADMLMLVRSGFYVHVNRSGRIQNTCDLSLILFLLLPRQEHLILFTGCRLHPHCKRLPRIRPAATPRVNNNAADIWLRGQAVGSWAACSRLTDD